MIDIGIVAYNDDDFDLILEVDDDTLVVVVGWNPVLHWSVADKTNKDEYNLMIY